MGARINPPPAPMRVPKAPTNKPRGSNHKYSTGISSGYFPFNLNSAKLGSVVHDLIFNLSEREARGISRSHSRTSIITLFPNNDTVRGEKRADRSGSRCQRGSSTE